MPIFIIISTYFLLQLKHLNGADLCQLQDMFMGIFNDLHTEHLQQQYFLKHFNLVVSCSKFCTQLIY